MAPKYSFRAGSVSDRRTPPRAITPVTDVSGSPFYSTFGLRSLRGKLGGAFQIGAGFDEIARRFVGRGAAAVVFRLLWF